MLKRLLSRLRASGLHPGRAWELPAAAAGRREAARWGYRIVLLREPDSEAALDFLAANAASAADLRNRLLQSEEFRAHAGLPVGPSMTGDEPRQEVQVDVALADRERLFGMVQSVWLALGETKPHWSVVTADEFRPDRIDAAMEAFFATGEANVATLVRTLERNGIDPARIRHCLDFGCGVGRLSVALAKRFPEVTAVDVSASHLAVARQALDSRGAPQARTLRLESIDGVDRLPEADLVFSLIVLQHNPPPVMRALFAGLLGRVRPGGAAVIQVPTYLPPGYRFDLATYWAEGGRQMEMHALPQAEVFALARQAGVEMLEVLEDAWTGFGAGSRSNTFVMRRPD